MKNFLFLAAAVICGLGLSAQGTEKVFKSTSLVYYGFDFTKAKMIGLGDESPHKIRDEYFKAWNTAALEKDFGKTFQKQAVFRDQNGVNKANAERETEKLVTDNDADFSADGIAEMVKAVPLGTKKDGLGVVFLVQSFNKTTDAATVHVVFFDVATRKVLLSKKVTGKPGGGTVLKAWSAAITNILDKIEKKEFDAWKKEAKY